MKATAQPELYYSDDGGVSDEGGLFSAWNREMWRSYAERTGRDTTWTEEYVLARIEDWLTDTEVEAP